MRRDFDLPEDDREYLDTRGRSWDAILIPNGPRWLILEDYDIPVGYNCRLALVGLQIESAYPDTQIDMVYFFPALALVSGKTIRQLSTQEIDGKQFQRWSRHRTDANPWRPGIDCMATHMLQVDEWLRRELIS